jgi:tRNA-binding protein
MGAPLRPQVTMADFEKLDIRIGTVIRAQAFIGARKPAIQLWVDFGDPVGVKKSSAQVTKHYAPAELVGRRVAAVVNFPPRQIGSFMSEVLCLGFPDKQGEVVLAAIDRPVPDGGQLF